MTGYAVSVQNGAALYASMYKQVAGLLGGQEEEEVVVEAINGESEGLTEAELSQLEDLADTVHQPDLTAEYEAIEDDPNYKLIMGEE